MYEKRFGLHRKPFQSVLTDHDFYQSETFREILPGVLHALRSDLGVAVLTGPAGVGKSVTLEAMRRTLEADCQAILIRGGTVRSAGDLLFMLHRKLVKCQPAGKSGQAAESNDTVRRWEVVERLQRVAEFWGPLVVLLDDAHLIEAEVFAELRALLEEEVDGQKLLRLLITGPLVLEEVLAEPNHSDFSQKIRTHVFLQPLRSSEAVEYLSHNITNAGGELSVVMDGPAIERIVAAADGVPRCLNLLADESLILGEELATDRVTRSIVDKALARLQHLPYTWNVSLYEDADDDDDLFDERRDEFEAASESPRPGDRNETKADSVIEIGDSTSTMKPASGVVEIGSSDSPIESSSGVVEIGGPVVVSQAVSAVASSIVAEERPGVFEIGAPTATPAVPLMDASISADTQSAEVPGETPLTPGPGIEITSSVAGPIDSNDPVEVNVNAQSTPDLAPDDSKDPAPKVEVEKEASVEEFTVEVDPFDASGIDNVDIFSDPEGFVEVAEDAEAEELQLEDDEADPDRFENEGRLSALFADPAPTADEGGLYEAAEKSDNDEDLPHDDSSDITLANIDDGDNVSISSDFSHQSLLTSHETDLPLAADTTESYETVSDEVLEEVASDILREAPEEEVSSQPVENSTEAFESDFGDHAPVALTEFSRWEPAGAWPAKSAVFANAPATQAIRPEKTPIFDRYTWCELGRSVTASQRERHVSTTALPSLTVWPPVTDGVAPQNIIPVEPADSQYADLLMDLSKLVNVTTEEASQDVHALMEELTTNTPTVPRSEVNELDEFYTDRKGLEESIERIQSLLDEDNQQDLPSEFMPQPPEGTAEDATEASASENDREPPSAADDGDSDWHGGPLVSDTMVPLADAAALERLAQNADEPWLTLPIDVNAVNGEDRSDPTGSDDSTDIDGSTGTESSDMHMDVDAPNVEHGNDEDVIQEDDELLSSDRQIGDFVADYEEEQQQAYRPRLLQQARQRVVSTSVGRGVLKRAAGAENVSLASEEEVGEAIELRLAVTAAAEQETEVTESNATQSAGSRFGNLFTRLRNLQKRSA